MTDPLIHLGSVSTLTLRLQIPNIIQDIPVLPPPRHHAYLTTERLAVNTQESLDVRVMKLPPHEHLTVELLLLLAV